MTFEDLKLDPTILRAIEEKGYTEPTDIQIKAVPTLISGSDLLAQSQTGTGKTAAFGLPLIHVLTPSDKKRTQALVLCPTRELCIQVSEEIRSFAHYKQGIRVVAIYGGAPIDRQIRDLKRGSDIVVATPGRLMDHLRRRTIRLDDCHMAVLDEADEMLNMGFIEDIEEIFSQLPEQRQFAFFSATMPKEIIALSQKFLSEPEEIRLSRNNLTVSRIEQVYYVVDHREKVNLTMQLLQLYGQQSSMIFCNTKKMVDELVTQLNKAGFPALGLHGDMKQEMRSSVMGRFKDGSIKVLIATDVAARGIDVDSMDVVINYDVPQELEYYVHRIGRTGRAGKEGLAITLVTHKNKYAIRQIERLSNSTIVERPLPTKDMLNDLMVEQFAREIRSWNEQEYGKRFNVVYEGLRKQNFSQEEIVIAAINKFIAQSQLSALKGSDVKNVSNRQDQATLGISLGKQNNIKPAHVVSAIATECSIRGKDLGRIKIMDRETYIDVPRELADNIIQVMSNSKINNQTFTIYEVKGFKGNRDGSRDRNRGRRDDRKRSGGRGRDDRSASGRGRDGRSGRGRDDRRPSDDRRRRSKTTNK